MAELGYYVVPNALDRNSGQRYILVNDLHVRHVEIGRPTRSKKNSNSRPEYVQYFKGTLLTEVDLLSGAVFAVDRNKIFCVHAESDTYFQCSKKDLKPINEDIYSLLLAISNCRDRYEISQNQVRLAEGLEMEVHDEVSVKVPNNSGEIDGVIRYKGTLYEKEGTHFGVELHEADGRGNTNGTIGKRRYFTCSMDSGVFLPLNRVRPHTCRGKSPVATPRKSKQSRMSGGESSQGRSSRLSPEVCSNTLNISKQELDSLGIACGTAVYIFTEVRGRESQERGKVKFIGRLPGGSGHGIYVGIDLDKPVGNGTGLYNGKHLFYTKQNHAALVPLSGVLPAYTINGASSTPPNNHVYEEVESLSRTDPLQSSTADFSRETTSRRQHNSEKLPLHLQKTFVQSTSSAHSSPPEFRGVGSSRLEDTRAMSETKHRRSPHRIAQSSRHELENGRRKERESIASRTNHLPKPDRAESSRSIASTSSFNRFHRDNSSEDELSAQDLYGSDDRVSIRRPLHDDSDDDRDILSSSPTMSRLYRPKVPGSLPGFAVSSATSLRPRSTMTAPGEIGRNHRTSELPIAEVVHFNRISNDLQDTIRNQAEMEVGTMVEVTEGLPGKEENGPFYGVIKWIGTLPEHEDVAAGVELEREISSGTDGTFNGIRYFECDSGKGQFVYLRFCRKDPRFTSAEVGRSTDPTHLPFKDFGNADSPAVPGNVPPPRKLLPEMWGKMRGIQGHHNSCYLDSTLFSLFAYSYVLDTILFRKRRPTDLPEYEETQKVLKELIINPLRKNGFVRADRIMQLRELLDKLGSVSGLVSEEKDPEEFLNTLLVQVFKAEPLMELRQGDSNAAHESYFYQIFTEKDEKMRIPNTQQLLEKSLISADLKFRNVPVCLILQMPRFGKDYKMYNKLRPSLELDITNLVEEMPRSCDICEGVAEYECCDCFLGGSLNESVFSYCKNCAERVHSHRKRKTHRFRAIKLPEEFREFAEEAEARNQPVRIDRQVLELFAVVCIATSHYVSFAKCGSGKDATWCFFDSMADRVGEQSGYNIPEITRCPDVEAWLQQDEQELQDENEKLMPELKRRLLCDSYMCMYQSKDMMLYK